MDVENLIGTMIQGALAGGGKQSYGAGRYLRGGGSSFLNASTLLTVGGLIWGAIETMQQQQGTPGPSPASAAPSPPPMGAVPPLPMPAAGMPAASVEPIPEGAAKIVRLMVSAARADGTLSEAERAAILEHARAAGAEALVQAEIAQPTPLARILEGVTDTQHRADLYTLAYGIVRADESVSGSEQIYLAQLAALLELDQPTVEALERDAAAKIDEGAVSQEGSGGGAQ
jgi:uncharacterized membrane protein YebE (DUF533 family)